MNHDPWIYLTIAGMTAATVLTRCLFFLSEKQWALPKWAERGLQYAPAAALSAVIAPEVLMTGGHLVANWRDARPYAALAGLAWYAARRGVLGTIVVGMAVYLPLHIGLGW